MNGVNTNAALRGAMLLGLCSIGPSCGSETTPPSQSAPSQVAAEPAARALDFSTCAGFGLPEASVFLGIPVAELEDQSSQQSWGKSCVFGRADAIAGDAVSFILAREESSDAAQLSFAQLRDNANLADDVIAGEGQSHSVEGLGDEAIWVRASTSLYVRSGTDTLTVTQPSDEIRQTALAQQLLR